jgi:integrase
MQAWVVEESSGALEEAALAGCGLDGQAHPRAAKLCRGEFGTPKSKRSSRAVPYDRPALGRTRQASKASSYTADESLVFGDPHTGKPVGRSRLLERFKVAATRANVGLFRDVTRPDGTVERRPLTRFHDLRHTFGTQMAAHGVPMRAPQELTGHRDSKTTLFYATIRRAPRRPTGPKQPSAWRTTVRPVF